MNQIDFDVVTMAGCKSTLFPGSLLYVLQHHRLCKNNGLWYCNVM